MEEEELDPVKLRAVRRDEEWYMTKREDFENGLAEACWCETPGWQRLQDEG